MGVRLQPDDLELLDLWIAANEPGLGRPEGIRRMLRIVAMRMGNATDEPPDAWMASYDIADEGADDQPDPTSTT